VSFFVGHGFSHERDNKPHFKFHMSKVAFFTLPNDEKDVELWWMNHQLLRHWNQALFRDFVLCSQTNNALIHFNFKTHR
jgi:hypothetical protein